MDRAKAAKRCSSLLRTANPKSGATESERATATRQALDLFAEYNLEVAVPEKPKRSPPPQQQRRTAVVYETRERSSLEWVRYYAHQMLTCIICGRPIHPGAECWVHLSFGYRCYDIACDRP